MAQEAKRVPSWIVVLACALTLGCHGLGVGERVCEESENPCTWDGRCNTALCKNPFPAAPACSTTVTSGNLQWSACDNGADISAYCAACYAEGLTIGGHGGWRIPTIDELTPLYVSSDTLSDVCDLQAYLNIDPGIDLSCVLVWSSTMTNSDPLYTQIVNFGATASHAVNHGQGSDTVYMRALVVHSP